MRVEQEFRVERSPEEVFDYLTDHSKLAEWQTSKTSVEPLTEGPARLGTRVRERTRQPGGKEFEQVVEFVEFDRPGRFAVHIVEGPYPVDGAWTLVREGDGTRVNFTAEGELGGFQKALSPVLSRMMARQFAGYHRLLASNVDARS